MKLGFFTACLPQLGLADVVDYAARQGFDSLEVAAWPAVGSRDFEAAHIDVTSLTATRADEVNEAFAEAGLTISAVSYYENNLHQDEVRRSEIAAHVRRCVDAARLLGVDTVGTFVGRHLGLSAVDNLALAESVLPPLVEYAGERGVALVVENCPMEGWHPDGYPANLAYSPELWEWMFSLGLFLNFDPSHLLWLGIDPVSVLTPEVVARVRHVQAKDTEIDAAARNRYGVFAKVIGRQSPWETGWWRYRVPGRGQVDWRGVVDALEQGGFDGSIAVEHEDPVWGGTPARVKQGLEIAYTTLRPLVRGERAND